MKPILVAKCEVCALCNTAVEIPKIESPSCERALTPQLGRLLSVALHTVQREGREKSSRFEPS
eukprot:6173898-Pleurochrysis_carterae.AAC.6